MYVLWKQEGNYMEKEEKDQEEKGDSSVSGEKANIKMYIIKITKWNPGLYMLLGVGGGEQVSKHA